MEGHEQRVLRAVRERCDAVYELVIFIFAPTASTPPAVHDCAEPDHSGWAAETGSPRSMS